MGDLNNNRAPLLGYIKLCALFRRHQWIPTGVTIWKRPIKVKIGTLLSRVTLKFDRWPCKTTYLLCYFKLCASFHSHLSIQTGVTVNSNSSYDPETAKFGFDLCDLDIWPLTLTFCMGITSVNGNNSWKFHNDTLREHSEKGVTDGQTDWTIHGAAWSQLKEMSNWER